MQGFDSLGRWIVLLGLILVVAGGLIWLVGRIPGLKQIPGTIQFSVGGVTVVIPLLASIVVSVVLTILLNVLARILHKP